MDRTIPALFVLLVLLCTNSALAAIGVNSPAELRHTTDLNGAWRSTMDRLSEHGFLKEYPNVVASFSDPDYNDSNWTTVDVPHNWDTYQGYRQLRHGNQHGSAFYRRSFKIDANERDRRIFLFFEGVGSYATVWVNGKKVGQHAGGLTTFTLDITDSVFFDRDNVIAVRADHPTGIRDLPWVCGGCELAYGFSEGPQPFGIFRPVHLVTTAPIRVEPFGVHAWIDGPQSNSVTLRLQTEVKNYSATQGTLKLVNRLLDREEKTIVETKSEQLLPAGQTAVISQASPTVSAPHLWSPADPYLYTVVSEIVVNEQTVDRVETPFGFRWISWPKTNTPDRRRLLVNDQPFFINGTADYEHQLGNNFAFSDTQIDARVHQIEAAGFNAFRDAHHPHNLRFQQHWDQDGLLWWTQFGAHIWFDNDAFRTNFKTLLRDWVKERRNSPSLILWGLQNESQLPTAFAQECSAIIRELDPTASTQRLITTCNGGTGTDWDVPQNWSGTYSGDPDKYDEDLRQQSLVGEYGAWRSLGLHTEGSFDPKSPLSENRLCALIETKIRLAEKVRADVCGQFQWPFTSHANPGRNFGELGEQLYDGIRPLDRLGPVNNKGLFTIWGEPTDAFYLYRANYAPKETQPMVYIVSHTWPDRWPTPGTKSGIVVYSNCDDVELFNGSRSLGHRTQGGRGTHFQWDDVEIDCNLLHAEARVADKIVARDAIYLNHLPAPNDKDLASSQPDLTAPISGQHYLYRINCGGPDYIDSHGNRWFADRNLSSDDYWGASSWAADYENLPPAFGSQRKIQDPISGTHDEPLYQTFRYGHGDLAYRFNLPDGDYQVELFFVEPWYGTGGGLNCLGWRVFDVAINHQIVIRNLDLWREAGHARAVKKIVSAQAKAGVLLISFPRVAAGQSVISAIAISSKADIVPPTLPAPILAFTKNPLGSTLESHLDTGNRQYADCEGGFTKLPYELFEADWIRTPSATATLAGDEIFQFKLNADSEVWIAYDEHIAPKPAWLALWEHTPFTLASRAAPDTKFTLYRKSFAKDNIVTLGENGQGGAMYSVFVTRTLPLSPPQFVTVSTLSKGWRAIGHAQPGARIPALGQALLRFPANLADGDLIIPDADKTNDARLQFTVNDCVEIVGAFSPASQAIAGWIETKQTAVTSEGTSFVLRSQRLPAKGTADFAIGDATPFFAFVRAVRPSTIYTAESTADRGFDWTIQVGVGDRYGLNFKYRNSSSAAIIAALEIVQANGSVLRTEHLEFPPTSASSSSWDILRTRTGASINAGTYTLRLKVPAPGTLQLSTLEVE